MLAFADVEKENIYAIIIQSKEEGFVRAFHLGGGAFELLTSCSSKIGDHSDARKGRIIMREINLAVGGNQNNDGI